MLNAKNGYYHRLVFKAVVLFTQIISCVAYIHSWIAPYQKILLGWGALLIVLELFRQLHKEGTTLIVVTHDPEVAEAAQRTIVLEHGRVAREVINENFECS